MERHRTLHGKLKFFTHSPQAFPHLFHCLVVAGEYCFVSNLWHAARFGTGGMATGRAGGAKGALGQTICWESGSLVSETLFH